VSHLALPLLAPAILAATALFLLRREPAPKGPGPLAEIAAALAFVMALAAAAQLAWSGPATLTLLAPRGLGLSARLDIVGVTMLLLITFVGWVVLRFSRSYLAGEPGQSRFTGWICATLAAALLLVSAGNLLQLLVAWVATSLCLHRLLLFYPGRPAAQRAARKKFAVARLADAALLLACLVLFAGYGTGDIGAILAQARSGPVPTGTGWAVALLVMAALLKSAQFPAHGWLVEVMEAPTPVSALLHAGIINAGGFLLIRFADLLLTTPGALAALVLIGGFTALLGGLVMLTQSAIKTSLAWSTVAQMGFMVLQCGLALFPLALLHIVAHSLYKAHAFLSSGWAVEQVAATRRPGPVAVASLRVVAQAFAFALALYALMGLSFGFADKSPQAIALGAILVFGVAYLIAQGLADAAPRALTLRTSAASIAASLSYFLLQRFAQWLTSPTLPPIPPPTALEWALIVLTLLSFGAVAFAQTLFPHWAGHPALAGLRVHLANGFYGNAIFDRLTGGWARPTSSHLTSERSPS
jgi:NAD(P)H-quinone oxidoreductase subunit 5